MTPLWRKLVLYPIFTVSFFPPPPPFLFIFRSIFATYIAVVIIYYMLVVCIYYIIITLIKIFYSHIILYMKTKKVGCTVCVCVEWGRRGTGVYYLRRSISVIVIFIRPLFSALSVWVYQNLVVVEEDGDELQRRFQGRQVRPSVSTRSIM